MGSISKDFKILQETYSKKIIAEAAGAANANKQQQPAPVTNAGVPGAISDAGPVAPVATPAAAAPAQPAKDQADFDAAVTKYFKTQGVSDADIKKFLDSTHTTLKSFATTNASAAPAAAPAGATKPWQPGFTPQSAVTPQAPAPAPAAAPVAPSTARYMPQPNAAAYGAPGFAGRPSYASR